MKIGIDSLVASPTHQGSIFGYTQSLIESFAEYDVNNDWVIFVSNENRQMFSGLRHSRFKFVTCGYSNERRNRRILSEQILLPYHASRQRLDVVYFLGDVCPFVPVCPYVVKLNTFHHYHQPRATGIMRTMYRRFVGNYSALRAARLIANSESTKRDAILLTGAAASKIVVIHEAIDRRFQPPLSLEKNVTGALTMGIRSRYVLFVSLLYRHKNLPGLLSAFDEAVRRTNSDHVLVIAGEDIENLKPGLMDQAARLGIADRVIFLGRVSTDDLVKLYQLADVFVYPSLSETFGKPPLEAMACGCPVIASNVGSIPEVVGDAALLCRPDSPSDIAAKIAMVLSSPSLTENLVTKGFLRVRQFSWERVAADTITALQAAARDSGISSGKTFRSAHTLS